jgi:putative solute:sodium symporter small subunit
MRQCNCGARFVMPHTPTFGQQRYVTGTRPASPAVRSDPAFHAVGGPGLSARKLEEEVMTKRRSASVVGVLAFDRRLEGLRRGILVMLAAWIAYFVVVEAFMRTLHRITVLGMPLSVLAVAQGCVLLFLGTLVLVVRWRRSAAG